MRTPKSTVPQYYPEVIGSEGRVTRRGIGTDTVTDASDRDFQ